MMTCAHVAAAALDIPFDSPEIPTGSLILDFPLADGQPSAKANIIKWFPSKENPISGEIKDIALLELVPLSPQSPLQGKLSAVPVVLLEPQIVSQRRVRMLGFPEGADDGKYANGSLQGPTGDGWIEIQHELTGGLVAEGFSGTAVWDNAEKAVTGMIVSKMNLGREITAHMIPVKSLLKVYPQLTEQCRPPNPYQDLNPFREKNAPFFFGRERVTRELVGIVQKQPVVAVIGASGSGKSSLILAGLIPALKVSGDWLVREFRPGGAPLYNLALALISLLYDDHLQQIKNAKVLKDDFRLANLGPADIIAKAAQMHPGRRFLLYGDQFEELFTLNDDKSLQHRFMDMLADLSAQRALPFTFLFTMRADFMSRAVGYGPFARVLDSYKATILSAMNEEELTAVIENPAALQRVSLAPGLTRLMLRDVGNEPGNLPLLEFALTLLWEKQVSRVISVAAYEAIGGVKLALARHADTIYDGFNDKERLLLRQVFIQLVRPGEGTEDTRQLALRSLFNGEKWDFIKGLADARLVVTGWDEESRQDTVEVVHEALITSWMPLREWLEDDRSFRV
ncbi:MAG: hypothetical protein GY757_38080, partial [bacterium]|nr:hypothetical protein [bacterium]